MIENETENSNHDHEEERCCASEEHDDENMTEFQPDLNTILNDDLEEDYHVFGN